MKLKDLINISYKNFSKDKKNIISIIVISIMFSLIMLCFSIRKSLDNYWSGSVKKLVDYRTYVVTFDNSKYNEKTAISKLKKYSHIVEAFDDSSYLISMKPSDKKQAKNSGIFLVGTISNPVKLYKGKDLGSASKNEKPVICSKQFYPYIENEQKKYLSNKSIDITDKVGKKINLSFITSKNKESFKIVGLYDAKENHTEGNVCYTRTDVVSDLNKKYQSELFNNSDENMNHAYLVIDDIKNEKEVTTKIRKDGFNIITPTLHINKDLGNKIVNLILLISTIIAILSICIIIFLFFKKMHKRRTGYAIMKTTGYSSNQIINVYILEFIFEFIFAFALSLALYEFIIVFIQKFYLCNKIVFYDLKIRLDYISLLINLLLSSLIIITMSYLMKKKMKKITIKSMVE